MSIQARLNKSTVQVLKLAYRVVFVQKHDEQNNQLVVALIYLDKDSFPVIAQTGSEWGNFWDCHDTDKAIRSIKRHNKDCLIIDRRDFIFEEIDELKEFSGIN